MQVWWQKIHVCSVEPVNLHFIRIYRGHSVLLHWLTPGNDTVPQWPPFSQPTGPQTSLSGDATPEKYFSEMISTDILDLLVKETNRYAQHRICTTPPTPRGVLANWRDTCRPEMLAFLSIILNMGIVQLSDIKEYWSTHETLNFSFFRYVLYL